MTKLASSDSRKAARYGAARFRCPPKPARHCRRPSRSVQRITYSVEVRRSGLHYLETITELLDRIRLSHPTFGLVDAAEVLWWWQEERPTDEPGQLFWLDGDARPVAAAVATQFGDVTRLDPLVMPDAPPEQIAHVVTRGCEHAATNGFGRAMIEVDRADPVVHSILDQHGFTIAEDGLVECWMAAHDRPPIAALADGYRLSDRNESADRQHHMVNESRGHLDPTARLRQTPLYRPDLDVVVYDADDNVAGYGLFWHNPTTQVGVLEPMRTEDDHQGRGIARHIITIGLDRLARLGATRLKVAFEPDNPAAKNLYLGCGFHPHRENDLYAGSTTI